MSPCANEHGSAAIHQKWLISSGEIAGEIVGEVSGEIVPEANRSLCLRPPASCASVANCYPLTLEACAGRAFAGWVHDATMEVRVRGSARGDGGDGGDGGDSGGRGICMDIGAGVGTYTCGSGSGYQQPNQHFSIDDVAKRIGTLSASDGPGSEPTKAGMCLSIVSA